MTLMVACNQAKVFLHARSKIRSNLKMWVFNEGGTGVPGQKPSQQREG